MVYVLLAVLAIGIYYLIYKAKSHAAEIKVDEELERLKGIQKRFHLSNYHMRRMAKEFYKYRRFTRDDKKYGRDRMDEMIYQQYSHDYAEYLYESFNQKVLEERIGFKVEDLTPLPKVLFNEVKGWYRERIRINMVRYVLDKDNLYPIPDNGAAWSVGLHGKIGSEAFQKYVYDYCVEHSILEDKNKERT